jgi:4-amino-4-deoxy-L-arabinose transferase-like glycosyltransferase
VHIDALGDAKAVQHNGTALARGRLRLAINRQTLILIASAALVSFLALYRLGQFPVTWFDEGSHLHVPKALVTYGVYADYSSEGFRYFGATTGVGPTVMLPVAAAFRLFGIGLVQARLVIVAYMLATLAAFFWLAKRVGGMRVAWVATALLVATRGAPIIEYGREVLGEVPGLFFLVAGLSVWFGNWERASWKRLSLVGLLFGLAVVTKQQYLLFIAPMLGIAWLADRAYYRASSHRTFILPAAITGFCYLAWQSILILQAGLSQAATNLKLLRDATAGAALVFSPSLMQGALRDLFSGKVYLGALAPMLLYAVWRARPRNAEGLRWMVLLLLVTVDLAWYAFASVGWLRYAFPGLAISSLFVACFLTDLSSGFRLGSVQDSPMPAAIRIASIGWMAAMIALPLAQTVQQVVSPPSNTPAAIAAYIQANVPRQEIIETWEPEVGFLTNNTFHYPPQSLLNKADAYVWLNGPPPSSSYNYLETQAPPYVLVGAFARWVNLYSPDVLARQYHLLKSIGGYDLYARNP